MSFEDIMTQPLPKIDKIVDSLGVDRVRSNASLPRNTDFRWSQKFEEIAGRLRGRVYALPNFQIDDQTDHSVKHVANSELHEVQKMKSGSLHNLLSAMVEVKKDETDENSFDDKYLVQGPTQSFMLFDPYICRSFEARLDLELQSAGLLSRESGPFDREICVLRKREERLREQVDAWNKRFEVMLEKIEEEKNMFMENKRQYKEMLKARGIE
jgi:hypothetical protein